MEQKTKTYQTTGVQEGHFGDKAIGTGDTLLQFTYYPDSVGQTWTGTIDRTLDGIDWELGIGTISWTSTSTSKYTEILTNPITGPIQDFRINWSSCPKPVKVVAIRS